MLKKIALFFLCMLISMNCYAASDSPEAKKAAETKEDKIYFDVKTMKWRDSQGVCNTCTEENGFPKPVVFDNFYYDPEDKSWHGPESGDICHTCSPENGFPENPDKIREIVIKITGLEPSSRTYEHYAGWKLEDIEKDVRTNFDKSKKK